jgi:hypothetical protein
MQELPEGGSMRILFFNTPGCPFCFYLRRTLNKINEMMPSGSGVTQVDVDKDDRSRFLEKLTDNEYPAVMIIKNVRVKQYNSVRVRPKLTNLMHGALDEAYNETFLKTLMRGQHDY